MPTKPAMITTAVFARLPFRTYHVQAYYHSQAYYWSLAQMLRSRVRQICEQRVEHLLLFETRSAGFERASEAGIPPRVQRRSLSAEPGVSADCFRSTAP